MTQYKVVHIPSISGERDIDPQEAIRPFQNAIEKEASEGWELVCSHTITLTRNLKLGLFGEFSQALALQRLWEARPYYIDILIFAKKDKEDGLLKSSLKREE
jgi:hypothetical protein